MFYFFQAGIRFDSQEFIVVHSFSTGTKAKNSKPNTEYTRTMAKMYSVTNTHTHTHPPVCEALGEQTQPTLTAPKTTLTETQLSLQLHDGEFLSVHTDDLREKRINDYMSNYAQKDHITGEEERH